MSRATQYFTRITQGVHPAYLDYYCTPHLLEEQKYFHIHMKIHKAHVIMLSEQSIITRQDAGTILAVICQLEKEGFNSLPLDPLLTDLYTNTEVLLIEKIGEKVGGKIHTARSRNDLLLTISRIFVREKILELLYQLVVIVDALTKISKDHIDTVMPGFTHYSQHAQPTTYSHFLLASADALRRDYSRLKSAFNNSNYCPMGAAAISTSGFPINRKRVSDLLGFSNVLDNSIDAISSRDYEIESAYAFCQFLSNVSRLNEAFFLWNSREFGLVELSDSFASTSTVMPQKKNPVALETIRADSLIASGYLSSMFGIINHITIGNGREPGYLDHCFSEIAERAIGISKLLPDLVSQLKINKERMLRSCAEGFSTVTELADIIVREKGLSFRTAHKIVGSATAKAIAQGLNADQINSRLIDMVSREVIGQELGLEEGVVRKSLDPEHNVQIRNRQGGPAPSETKRMIEKNESLLKEMQGDLLETQKMISSALNNLDSLALAYTDGLENN